ncbi:hypothetical protein O3686_02445 [Streptococcus parasanguinis]|uniref:hypothetical protein n=1 Tax=Streptococcus parasanguinis TaxID=1318 RepID=UPI001D067D24|nr:hypothetical protein [Streptococcus parasanguinis]MCB6703281.1 hypothetical protein [Streptococcus parasanguinis]MCB6738138.1 hypothetical protein [Streptococcus parasanguinis]MCB7321997.1 hypothetical protein [Streptococcus parasanguinis]MCB7401379.1 hypothetical protein [Streptococcus parasanguinis]
MVKMVLGSSDAQGRTMSSVGKARVTAYNSAVTALSNFNGAGDLQGSAYDSGKQYGVSVITPLIKGAIMYSEYLSEAVPKLPSKYRSEVGGEDLDSAVLEREIQSLESSISSLRGTFRAMESSDHADKSLLQNISSRMDSLTSQKNEKMDKLRKLNLFAGSSNEVFSGEGAKSMDTVVKNLASGLNMIQGDFASFGGTFPKHSGKTLNWAKSIEGEWDKKAKIDEDYQKVLEKANQGKELSDDDVKKIEAYQNRYGRELPDTITKAVAQFVFKKTKVAARGNSENDIKKLYKNIQDLDDNDWFKRGAQILGLTPEKLTKAFLQSDGIIELLNSVDKGTKGRKFVSGVMDAMAWYESLGKRGKIVQTIFDTISDIANPVEAIVKKGLEGVRDSGLLGKGLKYFPKVAKFLGKAGTVMTFADLGITAISSGVDEFSKSKDLGKAAGKGALSAVSSVGPFEGATIGAAFGGVPGALLGAGAGFLIQGLKAWKPKFFDDPVKGTKEIINDVGKGIKGTVKNISNVIGGFGKALGFG